MVCISLHLADFHGKCREIYHTWMLQYSYDTVDNANMMAGEVYCLHHVLYQILKLLFIIHTIHGTGIFCLHEWLIFMINCIYLHLPTFTLHVPQKSTIHGGKYTIVPWMVWVTRALLSCMFNVEVEPEVMAHLFAQMVTKGACQFSVNESRGICKALLRCSTC